MSVPDPELARREHRLIELLTSLSYTLERVSDRLIRDGAEDRETLRLILRELKVIAQELTPPAPPQPTLNAFQTGDTMAIGNIAAGQTGQFAVAIDFPSGVTPPANYNPTITWTAVPADPAISFAPATTDATNGAVPLAQQVVATVNAADANTSGGVQASALGTDGVTVLTSNIVTFTITPVPPPPPTEPTLVASQVA